MRVVGQSYDVSFKAVLASGNYQGSKTLGLRFFTYEPVMSQMDAQNLDSHVNFLDDQLLTDTINWTCISDVFVSDSAYEYVMIGAYIPYQSPVFYEAPDSFGDPVVCYYFIDDIVVAVLNTVSSCSISDCPSMQIPYPVINTSEPLTAQVEFPNIFTPNNDNINDYFIPIHLNNIESVEFQILNRWGNVVYNSKNNDVSWSGYSNGQMCSEGTYFWIAEVKGLSGESQTITGNVQLLR